MQTILENNRQRINRHYLANEQKLIKALLLKLPDYSVTAIHQQAHTLVSAIREKRDQQTLVEAFLHEYQLNSDEGIVLMEIAEALLRIPDSDTQDLFLHEKLSTADWQKHLQHSDSLLVNFATHTLNLTAKIEQQFKFSNIAYQSVFSRLSSRLGLPVIRTALTQAMQQLAYQFVIAETIEAALHIASQQSRYLYSFDMLGEAALTASDTERYINAYAQAIAALAGHANSDLYKTPGISIKLSALCPRYEVFQHTQAVHQISSKLLYLAKKARTANISVTVDAEESERLEMSLEVFSRVISDPELKGWSGLGLAVQAYQKRALDTLHYLAELAKVEQCKIPVRLVKGAYWDSEIKRAQVNGLKDYPVFTHKTATDLSYLACAQFMLSQVDVFYPQFATHNAHTVAAIMEMVKAKKHPGYEFQRLHGMGEQLYRQLQRQTNGQIPCRIYAPVGMYQELLPYLVRRLLENGANTSFINQVENTDINIEKLIADPVAHFKNIKQLSTNCVLPRDLYGKQRINSAGLNLSDLEVLSGLQQYLEPFKIQTWHAAPLVNGRVYAGIEQQIINPAYSQQIVGHVTDSDTKAIADAISIAADATQHWRLSAVNKRVTYLLKAAELLEENRLELVALCVREAGKTIKDALDEVREAVDFCRYYAQSAQELFAQPLTLPGPTGEQNLLYQYGRGVFVCISPWNFPIAIFIGQVTAALASGNTVIAKPAKQTPLIAMRCIQLLHQAGIPKDVLHFLPGDGVTVGRYLLSDQRISGVAFTGSLTTARVINQQLAQLPGIIPLIAETGGQNVMIADSSAHSEQLIMDAVQSAFNSAGQRCSALRVLYIPHANADNIISRIIGVMQQLVVADPQDFTTDIGPVISMDAARQLREHVETLREHASILFQMQLDKSLNKGCFFPPTLIELSSLEQLTKENFGPVLHVIRYHSNELEQLITDINSSGYGLTMGIHSRIHSTINTLVKNSKVGNIYINRNMISAVVGVQPFGGTGLSGTGPKAGGPNYLQRFTNEQTLTTNTAAIGGNAGLLAQDLD
ncbi:integrase [Methyloprofundus sedimenti]|uniref:Bifunctional protein PutA n=1 Tax=Methyloprofundus sedimenti TaxID=1420851 RepID=A0A1V8M9D3_9GAMM|nr:bifunctional proline dehydrogenase/L-glutamate gamma-semialdehyde dehydrogenase PutA [Methyloprofundus sedimenti]OQK18230.1 integrase [Methyloprofundus sedimenti]